MVTILRINGYQFYFYAEEGNEPLHIHTAKAGFDAKFWLTPARLAVNHGFRPRDLREIAGIIEQYEQMILEKWNEFSDLKVKRIEISADTLTVELMDGRVLSVPLAYYPTLLHATDAERKNCQPIGAGYGIEWPALDYHLSVKGLIQGLPEAPGLRRAKVAA